MVPCPCEFVIIIINKSQVDALKQEKRKIQGLLRKTDRDNLGFFERKEYNKVKCGNVVPCFPNMENLIIEF